MSISSTSKMLCQILGVFFVKNAMIHFSIILQCSLFITVYSQSVTVQPGGATVGFEGSDVTFTCIPTSFGTNVDIRSQWLINGSSSESFNLSSIFTGSTGDVGVLQLSNVSRDFNMSSIQCRIQSTTSQPVFLILQGTLEAVRSLNISGNDSHVWLTWTPPFSLDVTVVDPDIVGYRVTVQQNSTLILERDIQETDYTFLLPDAATPCDDFECTVNALNAIGAGTPGVVRLSQTKEVPQVLSDDLAPISINGVVQYIFLVSVPVCTVEVSAVDLETGDREENIPTSSLGETIEVFTDGRLEVGRRYNVTVMASNIAGMSHSFFILCDDMLLRPTPQKAAPTNLKIVTLQKDSATMDWTPKEHATGYIVKYMRSGIRDEVPKVVHTISEPRCTIGSLEADTKYEFQVAALSQHSSGPFSKPQEFQTLAKSKTEEVMEQVLQEEIQEVIQAGLQPENFARVMYIAGFESVDRESDDFRSIMSAVKDDITSQATEEMITKKFDKFVILLHENLKQQHFARYLVKKLCDVMPDYESPLNSALMKVITILQDIKEELIAHPVDEKMFGEAMYNAGFISKEAASETSNYFQFIIKVISGVEVHLTSKSTERLEGRLNLFLLIVPKTQQLKKQKHDTSRCPEAKSKKEEVRRYMKQVLQEEIQTRLRPKNFARVMCIAGFESVDRASDDFRSIMSAVKDDITSQSTEEMIIKKFDKFVIILHENLEQQHFARYLVKKLCNVMPDYESPLNSALMKVVGVLQDIKEQLMAHPVDEKMFGEAMYDAGFISKEAKDGASETSNYFQFINEVMSDVEVHLTSKSTEKLDGRLNVFLLLVLTAPKTQQLEKQKHDTSRCPEDFS